MALLPFSRTHCTAVSPQSSEDTSQYLPSSVSDLPSFRDGYAGKGHAGVETVYASVLPLGERETRVGEYPNLSKSRQPFNQTGVYTFHGTKIVPKTITPNMRQMNRSATSLLVRRKQKLRHEQDPLRHSSIPSYVCYYAHRCLFRHPRRY
jgi:hypothetical protein